MTTAILEACIVAAVWVVSAVCVSVIAVTIGHDGLTLATSIIIGAGVATGQIRTTLQQTRIEHAQEINKRELKAAVVTAKNEVKDEVMANTDITVKGIEKVEKAANGLSDRRAEEARAAGKAEGKAEAIATVAAVAPEVAPIVVKKIAGS